MSTKYNHENKDLNVTKLNEYTLSKTLAMFEYTNLPESLKPKVIEKQLQMNGFTFITQVEGVLYSFTGNLGGQVDVYGEHEAITINNPALNFNKTLKVKEDGVLITSDDFKTGLLPVLNRYNSAMIENDINLKMVGFNTRMMTLISASDDLTVKSAERYIEHIELGSTSVIGENAMFDGVKTHSTNNNSNTITPLIEYQQYLKATLNNELGINSNHNMKRERLVKGEVESVEEALYPFIDCMLANRVDGVDRLNGMYGLNVAVELGSIWAKKRCVELEDGYLETTNLDEPTDDPTDEPLDEPLDEALDEALDEPTDEPAVDLDQLALEIKNSIKGDENVN